MLHTKKDLNKTLWVKPSELLKQRKWYKVDATGKTLGRLATDIAKKLLGKDKAYYSDFWDAGDFVIVENVGQIVVTGTKLKEKMYYRYSGHKGHVKSMTLEVLLQHDPKKALWFAVR
jgi:large subunit ribosomal protein L13